MLNFVKPNCDFDIFAPYLYFYWKITIIVCFCSFQSTMSSGLSSLSAMTVEDYIRPFFKNLSDKQLTLIAKLTGECYHYFISFEYNI